MWESFGQRLRHPATRLDVGVFPLPIGELISPLRYDVEIRVELFRLIEEYWDWATADLDRFIEVAARTSYHTWFRRIVPYRNRRLRWCSPDELEAAFRIRVTRSVAMAVNVKREGLKIEHSPVSLTSAPRIVPTTTGKHIVREFYLLDGCHRLALLVNSGATELLPAQYVVRRRRVFRPVDNTGVLVEALRLPHDVYYRFLSQGYVKEQCLDRASLLQSTLAENAGRYAELQHVLAFDEPALVG